MRVSLFFLVSTFFLSNCGSTTSVPVAPVVIVPPVVVADIDVWLTKSDQSALLQKQSGLIFENTSNSTQVIDIDTTQSYQTIDGFGYTLTGGSAMLINQLNGTDKTNLLKELFGNDANSIGVSYLRISIGASDLDASVFSYSDIPTGQTDPNLSNFSLKPDEMNLIPVLKEILKINPKIRIMASPWSAPIWMKSNQKSVGGSLLTQYYQTYSNYFVKYIQEMKAQGIDIEAITIQNEPQNPNNNPSMSMSSAEQATFVKTNLGPAFKTANIKTKIIIWDHNCDDTNFPINVLNDEAAKTFIDGSAFHLYAGNITALSVVRNAHSDKNVYFTEQWTSAKGDFGGDLKWHLKNVIVGSMRNWSKNALEWNLANDPSFGPRTPGGCTECKGALTINGSSISRNVSYYIIAHASKFVPAGSVRIASSVVGNLQNVAFKTPSGKKVLIVENDGSTDATFAIQFKNKKATANLAAGAVATYIW